MIQFTIGNISIALWQIAIAVSVIIMWWIGTKRYQLNAEKTNLCRHLRPVWIVFAAVVCTSWVTFELFRTPSVFYDGLVATFADKVGNTDWLLMATIIVVIIGVLAVCLIVAIIAASYKKAILKYKIAKRKAKEV